MDHALAGRPKRLDRVELALLHLGLVSALDDRHTLARVDLAAGRGSAGGRGVWPRDHRHAPALIFLGRSAGQFLNALQPLKYWV